MSRVGILTGGGDVPGLNAAIKAFAVRMHEAGWEVVGLRRGFAALLAVAATPPGEEPDPAWVRELAPASIRTIDRTGGTVLHTSRVNPELLAAHEIPPGLVARAGEPDAAGRHDLTAAVVEAIGRLRLDLLVAVGGDGTLSFARRLHREGVPVVAVPKTMDNDVAGTDYCIGFSTAVTRSVHFVNDLRTSAGSHERFLVVELFGRYSGETCLLTALLASADRALIAEVPFDPARVAALAAADKRDNPSSYAVLVVSEGARPIGGAHVESGERDALGRGKLGGVGEALGEILRRETGERAIVQRLGYLMRSGAPDALDLLVARNFGNLAAGLALTGRTGRMVAVVAGRYADVALDDLPDVVRQVDVDRFYDREAYRPKIVDVAGLPMFLH